MHNKGIKGSFLIDANLVIGYSMLLSDKVCVTLYTGDHPHF